MNKKKWILPVVVAIIVFITVLAYLMPPAYRTREICQDDDVLLTLTAKDITSYEHCTVDSDGNIVTEGNDAIIRFSGFNIDFKSIRILAIPPQNKPLTFYMKTNCGTGYEHDEEDPALSTLNEFDAVAYGIVGDESFSVACGREKCQGIQIMSNMGYTLKAVEFHADTTTSVNEPIPRSTWIYPISVLIGLLFGAFVFFIDYKLDFTEKWYAKIYSLRFVFLKVLGILVITGVLSVIIESVIGFGIMGPNSAGKSFVFQRFIMIYGILFSLGFLWLLRDSLKEKPENVFLGLILTLGITMILAAPFGYTCWDESSHFNYAHNASSPILYQGYSNQADVYARSGQSDALYWYGDFALVNESRQAIVDAANQGAMAQCGRYTTLAHVPSGLALAMARLFNLSYHNFLRCGVLVNLLIYAFAAYFGMRRLKSGKMIMAIIALFPTAMFLATNFSYDFWVNGFTLLGMGYFMWELQRPDTPVSVKNQIIMCGAFAIGCIPKLVYAVALFIPFFMKKRKGCYGNRKRYYAICLTFLLLTLAMFGLQSVLSIGSGGDIRGGGEVNSQAQFVYILTNPLEYANTLFRFLSSYLSLQNAAGYISAFGFLGDGRLSFIIVILLIIAVMTDKNQYDMGTTDWKMRLLVILYYIGTSALVASALYISFTPVGSDGVSGCQARYLIPLIYPLCALIGPTCYRPNVDKQKYHLVMLTAPLVVNYIYIGIYSVSCWM